MQRMNPWVLDILKHAKVQLGNDALFGILVDCIYMRQECSHEVGLVVAVLCKALQ